MKFLFIIFLSIYAMSFAAAQTSLPRVRVDKNLFKTDANEMIVFRGLNTSDPEKLQRDGHWNAGYFKEMKSWGANIVRFPVHPAAWRRKGQDAYLALLDEGVRYAESLGMYVIIDWHSIGNLCTEKFQSPNYETTFEETKNFWDIISKKYGASTTVAFFELFNEPTVMGGKLGACTWSDWKKMNEEIISLIRKNRAQTIALVAGFNWAYDLTEAGKDPVQAEGVAYVSHPYPMKRPKPWEGKWTADWGFLAERYPLILTEIGFCGENDRGAHVPVISDESYGDAITRYSKANNISYVVWVFDPQWSPMLINNWQFEPTRQGKYFKNALSQQ